MADKKEVTKHDVENFRKSKGGLAGTSPVAYDKIATSLRRRLFNFALGTGTNGSSLVERNVDELKISFRKQHKKGRAELVLFNGINLDYSIMIFSLLTLSIISQVK